MLIKRFAKAGAPAKTKQVGPGRSAGLPGEWLSPFRHGGRAEATLHQIVRAMACLYRPRKKGSRASRKPSPSRLNPMTVITMARPGNVAIHHAESM
jgi:hypothetical protein